MRASLDGTARRGQVSAAESVSVGPSLRSQLMAMIEEDEEDQRSWRESLNISDGYWDRGICLFTPVARSLLTSRSRFLSEASEAERLFENRTLSGCQVEQDARILAARFKKIDSRS